MTTRRSPTERLAELEAKKLMVDRRIAALSASERQRQRKYDDRCCILLGSIVLSDLSKNSSLADYIKERLPEVKKDADRQLLMDLLQRCKS